MGFQLHIIQTLGNHSCWDAILFWNTLKRFEKDLHVNPRTICFLAIRKVGSVRYDMSLFVLLNSTWRSRITFRHVDPLQNLCVYYS